MAGRRVGYESPKTIHAALTPTIAQLYWAAGLIEGEGTFSGSGSTDRVIVAMVDKEPIAQLQQIFGGNMRSAHSNSARAHGWSPQWKWWVTGSRARGVMMTLYALLSPRRQAQIRKELSKVFVNQNIVAALVRSADSLPSERCA